MTFGLEQHTIDTFIEVFEANSKVDKAYIFGSRAKGNYRPDSDIDISIKGYELTIDDIIRMSVAFEDKGIKVKIDLIDYNSIKEPALKEHIDRVGIEFYSRWKEYKLGELTKLITKGTTPSSLGGKFIDKGINYIKSEAVSYNGKIDKSTFVFIDEVMHQKLKRSQLAKDDILYSMAGIFLGKNGLVTEDMLPANTNQALAIIRLDKNKALPKFIHYYLRQKSVIDFVNNMSGQSAQPNINFEEIKAIDISLPPLPEQTTIASILNSLDDKIDLLHRQNKTLEQLTETLFRQWFVEEAEDSWEEKSLYDVIELIGGGTPKTDIAAYWDGKIKWLSCGDIASNHKSFVITSEKTITDIGLQNSSAKLLLKFSMVITARGTVGKYCLLSEPMTFSQSNYGIKPKYDECYFFTYLMIAYSVEELQAAAYGSVFDTITTNTFKEHKISLPKIQHIKQFEETVKPYFFKMLSNQTQIRTLTKLRDTLLPKLMSGEVRVI